MNIHNYRFSSILFIMVISAITSYSKLDSNYFTVHYSDVAKMIISHAMKDTTGFERLAYMCDTFGPRLSGSDNLENALNWAYNEMKKDGYDSVVMENVMVPHWVRGNEYCELVSPRNKMMNILGLGGSIGTPKSGLTAEVLVVSSFNELKSRAAEAKGKIVVYNFKFQNYGQAVQFRFWGAVRAAEVGAIAALTRPAGPHSMNNPHTGMMVYDDTIPKIPTASITGEDAHLLYRLQQRGQKPVLHLYMEADTLPDAPSHNIYYEIKGTEKPDEIIAFGGHSDSWDVGQGAQDDGAGILACWHAIKTLKDLGIKPKKTLRAVFWVNEENGNRGGKAYAEYHKNEKHALLFEFDSGLFPPSEIGFTTSDSSLFKTVKSFEPLLRMIDSIKVREHGGGVDIGPLAKSGVPSMSLNTRDEGKYFWYHHSNTDTIDKIDPKEFNKCAATIALVMYLYSEIP